MTWLVCDRHIQPLIIDWRICPQCSTSNLINRLIFQPKWWYSTNQMLSLKQCFPTTRKDCPSIRCLRISNYYMGCLCLHLIPIREYARADVRKVRWATIVWIVKSTGTGYFVPLSSSVIIHRNISKLGFEVCDNSSIQAWFSGWIWLVVLGGMNLAWRTTSKLTGIVLKHRIFIFIVCSKNLLLLCFVRHILSVGGRLEPAWPALNTKKWITIDFVY